MGMKYHFRRNYPGKGQQHPENKQYPEQGIVAADKNKQRNGFHDKRRQMKADAESNGMQILTSFSVISPIIGTLSACADIIVYEIIGRYAEHRTYS